MRYADGKYREKEYTAYVHITPSKKRYVGITSQVPRCRWNEGEGYKSQKLFYRAIQKYGWKNIQHIIIAEHLTLSEASDLEKSLIDKFKSNQKEFGYNLTDGGEGLSGYRLTDEQKEKCRQSSTGRHHTQATKDKISKINKGRKLNLTDEQRHICAERAKKLPHYKKTAEQRQRMSEAYEKRRDRPAHTTPHSEETKRKISEAAKNRKPISEETRRKLSEAAKKQWKRQKQMKKGEK